MHSQASAAGISLPRAPGPGGTRPTPPDPCTALISPTRSVAHVVWQPDVALAQVLHRSQLKSHGTCAARASYQARRVSGGAGCQRCQAEPWNTRTFPAPRRPAQPRPPGMTSHPCRESPARPSGPRRPARTGGSRPPGHRGRASGWTRIRRLGPGCPRAPRAFRPGPGPVPGTDQPYNIDNGEYQHHHRGDEQNPEAEIGHQACLPSAGDGLYTGESVARHVLVTGGSKFRHD